MKRVASALLQQCTDIASHRKFKPTPEEATILSDTIAACKVSLAVLDSCLLGKEDYMAAILRFLSDTAGARIKGSVIDVVNASLRAVSTYREALERYDDRAPAMRQASKKIAEVTEALEQAVEECFVETCEDDKKILGVLKAADDGFQVVRHCKTAGFKEIGITLSTDLKVVISNMYDKFCSDEVSGDMKAAFQGEPANLFSKLIADACIQLPFDRDLLGLQASLAAYQRRAAADQRMGAFSEALDAIGTDPTAAAMEKMEEILDACPGQRFDDSSVQGLKVIASITTSVETYVKAFPETRACPITKTFVNKMIGSLNAKAKLNFQASVHHFAMVENGYKLIAATTELEEAASDTGGDDMESMAKTRAALCSALRCSMACQADLDKPMVGQDDDGSAKELIAKLKVSLDNAKSVIDLKKVPVIESKKITALADLAALDKSKGGMPESQLWDADMPAKPTWTKWLAIAKATLRKSTIAAELLGLVEATEKSKVAYTELVESLNVKIDADYEKQYAAVVKTAIRTHVIGSIVYTMETVSDKKQKREAMNNDLLVLDAYNFEESTLLPKVLLAAIEKARAYT
jgi:hypothetical protein